MASENANDYDLKNLEQALALSNFGGNDIVFVVTHALFRNDIDHSMRMFEILRTSGAKIVVDIVPHTLYQTINLSELNKVLGEGVAVIIGEYPTFMEFLGRRTPAAIVIRYGVGNISMQTVCSYDGKDYEFIEFHRDTGYEHASDEMKIGFGDRLTAELVRTLSDREYL